MALPEQQISDTDIARIYREIYGATRFSDLDRKFALRVIECFLSSLPKPEPIGEVFMGLLAFDDDELIAEIQQERFNNLPDGAKLYTEAPIAPPASEQRTVEEAQWRNIKAVVRQLADWAFGSADDPKYGSCWLAMVTGLTCKDGPDFKIDPLPAPQIDYKAQRDAERYRWLLENNKSWSWNPAKYNKEIITGFAAFNTGYLGFEFESALDAAIASVKGGE